MINMIRHILLLLLLLSASFVSSQDRITLIETELEALVVDLPGLEEKVEFTTNNISLQEFIRGIGISHSLNVSVDDDLSEPVVNNFSNARVLDVFVFLCKTYSLEIEFTGDIISFHKYIEPQKEYIQKELKINYDERTDFLSLDLKNDSLSNVIEELTKISEYTILMTPGLENKTVNIFIENRPFAEVIQKLAITNEIDLKIENGDYFVFSAISVIDQRVSNDNIHSSRRNNKDKLFISASGNNKFSISADDVPIVDIIDEVSSFTGDNYLLYNKLEGNGQLFLENTDFNEFLIHLLNGSKYTFKVDNEVFLIGKRSLEGLRKTELLQLENRVVEKVIDIIPDELKQDIDIKVFEDLNGLVLSGSSQKIEELKRFIVEIDKVVPMINIELIIVDLRKSNQFSAGVSMGVNGEIAPATSTGKFGDGGFAVNLNSNSVNSILSTLNGFGSINLGQVGPDFYLSMEAMEEEGYINTRMKPRLSALNGQESELTIGSTEYYLEVKNDLIGTQNPIQSQSQQWIPTTAELKVKIVPVVSSDGQVTLDIVVSQSDFTARVSDTGPPGSLDRTFTSTIRVRDGDMILIGGLEDKTLSKSRTGVPFLSKIPGLGWLFGKKRREKSISTLNIFLKPTIYY